MAAYAESVGEMVDACPNCGGTDIGWFPIYTEDGKDAHHQCCWACEMIIGGYEYCEPDLETATCVDPPLCVVCGVSMSGTMQPDPDKHTWSDPQYIWYSNGSGYDAEAIRYCRNGCLTEEKIRVAAVLTEHREATCTQEGYFKYVATFDVDWAQEQVYEYETAELGHNEVIDEAVPASCTETGLTEGSHCDVCGEVIVAQEEIPALGHTEVVDEAVPASCTTDGLTEGKHCDACGEVLVAQEEIPAWGHYDGNGDKVCDNCGANLTNPQTGDESFLTLAAMLLMVSSCCLAVLPAAKKRFVR